MKKSKSAMPLTEEERLAFEEQKRLAEEEIRKKREDVLVKFLKDKVMKEEKASIYNMNKINSQWRTIMREAKAKELLKDVEILSQTFERVMDSKDAVIKSLSKDLSEAEEQYSVALKKHLQMIDFLLDYQNSRVEALTKEYALELEITCREFDLERSILLDQNVIEINEVSDILFSMEEEFQRRGNEARAEFQSMQDEIKNKNLEEKHALKVQMELKIEDLWQQFRQALHSYNEINEERKNTFEILRQKDAKKTREIELQMRKLQRISDQISQIRGKLSAIARECEERNKSIKEDEEDQQITKADKERIHSHLLVLKEEMNQMRIKELAKLTTMTVTSHEVIKEIKRQKKKGEMVLKLTEACRKLETEEEKVVPFYSTSLTDHEQELAQAAIMETPKYQLTNMLHQCSELENFWKRYNKVLLDKLSLDKDKQQYLEENNRLRILLKQYLDGISVNDEILSKVNPLLVVNNKTSLRNVSLMEARVKKPAPKTVIEAAHIVNHILK